MDKVTDQMLQDIVMVAKNAPTSSIDAASMCEATVPKLEQAVRILYAVANADTQKQIDTLLAPSK